MGLRNIGIIDLFNGLMAPAEEDNFQYSALPIPDFHRHRIAKDKTNNPVLLLSAVNSSAKKIPNIRLQNVAVLFNLKCTIQQNSSITDDTFTTISFIGKEDELKMFFLKLCFDLVNSIGEDPSQEKIRNEIANLIRLLSLVTQPPLKTIQGLWGELFVISICKNVHKIVSCWHFLPNEKYDFNDGIERLEVKTSTSSSRIHTFALEQLNGPEETDTLIASLFVKQISRGKSIIDLQDEIISKLRGDHLLIEKVKFQVAISLGNALVAADEIFYDWHVANTSISFYKASDIPKINLEVVPPLVSDVSFKSDLSLSNPSLPSESGKKDGLFEAI